MGKIFLSENVSFQNYQNAISCFKDAAHENYAPALTKLGQIYFEGKIIEKNLDKASKYYKLAAYQNYAKALYSLGRLEEAAIAGYKYLQFLNTHSEYKEKFIKILKGNPY